MKEVRNRMVGAQRGMSLVETAVAVGVMAGALAILGPTLHQARENAKRAACISNLGQVTRGMVMYAADLGQVPIYTINDYGWTDWNFGGWSGSNRTYWEEYYNEFNIQTNRRPLSVYLSKWPIAEQVDKFTPTQETPLFKCPSDSWSPHWQWSEFPLISGLSSYDDIGTSYVANWSWWDQTESIPDWSERGEVGQNIYHKYMAGDSSRFIMLMEAPMDWGLNLNASNGGVGIQTPGWHGEFSKHVVGYADGRVEYRYFDTRHLHDSLPNPPGPRHGEFEIVGEWTACDQTLNHPGGGRHD